MRVWHPVSYEHLQLVGEKLPEDGAWNIWKDKFGNVEIARFKYDAMDHFFPPAGKIKEENIVAWSEFYAKSDVKSL